MGLHLRFHTDGRVVRAEFQPRPEHAGFRDVVHGGLISTVLDEIMVWACAVGTKQFGYCVELSVRFLHPLRPGRIAVATAELTANRKNRVFETAGKICDGETVLATATGKYLPLKSSEAQAFLPDLIGDLDFLKPHGLR